jgi:hypothetical protein
MEGIPGRVYRIRIGIALAFLGNARILCYVSTGPLIGGGMANLTIGAEDSDLAKKPEPFCRAVALI